MRRRRALLGPGGAVLQCMREFQSHGFTSLTCSTWDPMDTLGILGEHVTMGQLVMLTGIPEPMGIKRPRQTNLGV